MLQNLIDFNAKESDIQEYLVQHDDILKVSIGQPLWGYNVVLPQFRLGADGGISDFLVVSSQSYTYEVHIVEIKLPSLKMFKKDGSPASGLGSAVFQAHRYSSWIGKNMEQFKGLLKRNILEKDPDFVDDFDYKEFNVFVDIVAGRRGKPDLSKSTAIKSIKGRVISYDRLMEAEKRLKEMKEKNVPIEFYSRDFLIAKRFGGCVLNNKLPKD